MRMQCIGSHVLNTWSLVCSYLESIRMGSLSLEQALRLQKTCLHLSGVGITDMYTYSLCSISDQTQGFMYFRQALHQLQYVSIPLSRLASEDT